MANAYKADKDMLTWRANLEKIPATIQELAAKYADGGGDREALENAIKPT